MWLTLNPFTYLGQKGTYLVVSRISTRPENQIWRLSSGTRQTHCCWRWAQTLQLTPLSTGYSPALPSSFWKPHRSLVPSPEHTLHDATIHTSLFSEFISVCLHPICGVHAKCLLSSFKGDWEGGFLASHLRMYRHIRREMLLNVDGVLKVSHKSWQMSIPQLFSQPSYLALLLTTVTSLFKLAKGHEKRSAEFPTPWWRNREKGANAW